ncbi:hydroxyethylthiazole kinase [Adlercreutzia faecimuris]|uniref:Hydroxyethylthiazole kinase n=1 Tax=Adlercreutzia faecimuris TaxID=2897341 RepID=A0ABS9WHW0_9ACTN|nr:hydroxyethylthiazole kinase [Adlercreutzia sp. JBNU-10]MCI2242360.1 hydroxyethylthiazole kinase [Adlercreutzia sp. JBNU-10]
MTADSALDLDALRSRVARAVDDVRASAPLAPAITNAITMDFVANAQLAVGGSAAMVYLPEEAVALAQAGGAFYVNMGALLPTHRESIPAAARACRDLGRPWVLDPVGIGIGGLRGAVLDELAACGPAIVRANASEVIALAQAWGAADAVAGTGRVRGVDSADAVDDAARAAAALARRTDGAVAVSGEDDLVTDGRVAVRVAGGSPLMARVTGFGCSLGGVAAVYAAVADPLTAAVAASAHYAAAGTAAEARAAGPASFKVAFIDALFNLTAAEIAANPLTIEEVRS